MKSYSLEELAKHHERTASVACRYVVESVYQALELRNTELVAQVEALKNSLNFVASVYTGDNKEEHSKFVDWVSIHRLITSESPTQHLRDIQAKAGRDGYQQGIQDWRMAEINYENFDITFESTEYAESVRRGL